MATIGGRVGDKAYTGFLIERAANEIASAEEAIADSRRIHGVEPEHIEESEAQIEYAKGLFGQLKDIYRMQ